MPITKSFFTKAETDLYAKKYVNLNNLQPECSECGLFRFCDTPAMDYTGEGRRGVLIIAEAPGSDEDYYKKQLIGRTGQFLRDKLSKWQLDLDKDFYKINAVNCWPNVDRAKNRTPTSAEIAHCKPMVDRAIMKLNPWMIWLLGGSAVESFYKDRFSDDCSITRFRGLVIPDRKASAWVLPLFHPSFPQRDEKNLNLQSCFDRDLEQAVWMMDSLERPVPIDITNRVKVLYKFEEVCNILDKVIEIEPSHFFFDYETSGVKPYKQGHRIASMSFCYDGEIAYSFPMMYKNYWTDTQFVLIKRKVGKILTNPKIKKQAHNLKMEDAWSRVILGYQVQGWEADSMIDAHIIDVRPKFTSLKFQLYVNFGIDQYNQTVKPYLEDVNKAGFNRVDDCPLPDLLQYGGFDSWGGYRLVGKQRQILEGSQSLHNASQFFLETIQEFSINQDVGIPVDIPYYKEQDKILEDEIKALQNELIEGTEGQKFFQHTGRKIDLGSPVDMRILTYDILKAKAILTDKQNLSVSRDSLETLDIPFMKKLVTMRKKEKTKGTYLAQFIRSVAEDTGKMYPSFDLNTARSLRSSSSDPNFQNIPVRDAESKQICRSGIKPSPGNKIMENDFKSIEVNINACYSKDPALLQYVNDDSLDMHRDEAMSIFMLEVDRVSKDLRYISKNGHVFPEFYGSYYGNTAPDIWERSSHYKTEDGEPVMNHLRKRGIKNLDDFTHHMQDVENKMRGRFRVHWEWREKICEFYREHGYVETYHGFRRGGYLTKNECGNTPVQATAFHCLCYVYNKCSKLAREEKWVSKIMGQIHDSIVWNLYPPEQEYIIKMIKYFGEKLIRKDYKWLLAPLKIEFELTGVDESWYNKKEIKIAA